MRRVLASVVGVMLLLPLGALGARAAPEKYPSKFFNAYWNTRAKIDSTDYKKIQWYSGVYDSGDGNFWSDLYRSVQRCEKRDGPDRCHGGSFWYGDINDLGDGTFTMDSTLTTGHLDATYRLHTWQNGQRILIGKTAISVDLVGTGDVTRSSESYTYTSGCYRYSYRGHSKNRDADATGTYQIGSDPAKDFGGVSDFAYMSVGKAIELDTSHCH
jgi:hypothetical protein